MLDAYTIRKAIPRIVIAVIALNISIYLCIGAIDVVKVAGHGLGELLTTPFTHNAQFGRDQIQNNGTNVAVGIGALLAVFAGGAAVIWAPAVIGGAALFAIPLIAAFIISASLIMLAVLFTLAIRQALLIFCVVTSPVAIALSVLPGTEKYFKKWLDLFISTLMVYPIIAAIFAMSTVMTYVLIGTADSSPDAIGLTKILSAMVVAFAPLVLIPFAFKLAGGAISAVMNAGASRTSSLSRQARQGLTKMRQDPNSLYGKAYNRNLDKRLEHGQTGAQVFAGVAARARGKSYRDASKAIFTEKSMKRSKELAELDAMQPIAGNDDYLEAMRQFDNDSERKKYLFDSAMKGKDPNNTTHVAQANEYATQGVAAIARASALGSRQELQRFAAVQLASTGTGYGGGAHEMNAAILEASGARKIEEKDSEGNIISTTWEGGDTVLQGNLMAKARANATQAKRLDLVAGFGTNMGALGAQKAGATKEVVNEMVTDNSLDTNGAGMHLSMRGNSVENMIPAMNRRVDRAIQAVKDAHATGNEHNIAFADRQLQQELASTAAMLDVASNVSPENARKLADRILGRNIDLSTMPDDVRDLLSSNPDGSRVASKDVSLNQIIERMRTNPEFQQMRREYGSNQLAQYQASQSRTNPGDPMVPPGSIPFGPEN